MSKAQSQEVPEVTIKLSDHYREHLSGRVDEIGGGLSYWPDDEDRLASRRLISEIRDAANKQGATIDENIFRREDKGTHFYDHGIDTAILSTIVLTFGGLGGAIGFLKFAQSIVLQWMKNRASRSVTLKVGDKEVKISGTNDVEQALRALEALGGFTKPEDFCDDGNTTTYSI